jgi:hypothetical protein|tara:strand:+ start:3251 stop:3487 length:237 start_codon:yes stop_codon:yes gene_type:complete
MAKGLQDYTLEESVSPYVKAVVATTNDQASTRAVHMKGTAADITLTIDGVDVVFHLLKGHTYPISCTKASAATVVMLY